MSQLYKAIIFDMGGVILRTVSLNPRQELANQCGKTVEELSRLVFSSPVSIASEKGLLSRQDFWKELMHLLGVDEKMAASFEKNFFGGDKEDQAMVHLIETIRSQYKLGLLSNAFEGTRQSIEKHYSFLKFFDVALFSYEVGERKPDEHIFKLILEKLQVAPYEALFIDDLFENVLGAQRLGIQTIWYRQRDAAFAYLKSVLVTNG